MPDNIYNGNDETKLSDEQAFADIGGISEGDVTPRHLLTFAKLQIELAIQLKGARLEKNMTQEEVASILHTKKPAISRLETCHENVKRFPSILTLVKFASAIGYELKIGLVPLRESAK